MLINFSVENWMSFRDEAIFSMVAGSEEQNHQERLSVLNSESKLLPIAAIYGENGAGKTAFFKALNFCKYFVTSPLPHLNSKIPVDNFLLDSETRDDFTKFSFEILADDQIYKFSFSLNKEKILEEKLEVIDDGNEKLIYDRQNGEDQFDNDYPNGEFLKFIFKGTRSNQLFLTNAIFQNIATYDKNYQSVYNWFSSLVLISPDSRFIIPPSQYFEDNSFFSYEEMNDILLSLDIKNYLKDVDISLDSVLTEFEKIRLQTSLNEGSYAMRSDHSGNQKIFIFKKNGELVAKKLVTCHLDSKGQEVHFEMSQESDGTKRIIDLLPLIREISSDKSKPKVYIIDEIEHCLHHVLLKKIIESFLDRCGQNNRSQLFFTTHDVLLMDRDLLRTDEIWIAEKNNKGVSSICSLYDYQGLYSGEYLKENYLMGRFGGVPDIIL